VYEVNTRVGERPEACLGDPDGLVAEPSLGRRGGQGGQLLVRVESVDRLGTEGEDRSFPDRVTEGPSDVDEVDLAPVVDARKVWLNHHGAVFCKERGGVGSGRAFAISAVISIFG
jgi:hypothetical protein